MVSDEAMTKHKSLFLQPARIFTLSRGAVCFLCFDHNAGYVFFLEKILFKGFV